MSSVCTAWKRRPRDVGQERQAARAQQRARQERPGEQPPLLARRRALEDQRGSQADQAQVRVLLLVAVEHALEQDLVLAVGRRRDAGARPALVDQAILRPRAVDGDRGGRDEAAGAGRARRIEHALRADDVRAPEPLAIARGLDLPRQVHHRVGALERAGEIVVRHIRLHEARERELPRRPPARDADDLVDRGVGRERRHEGGADVARRTRDRDPHRRMLPLRPAGQTAVSFAPAGDSGA